MTATPLPPPPPGYLAGTPVTFGTGVLVYVSYPALDGSKLAHWYPSRGWRFLVNDGGIYRPEMGQTNYLTP